VAITWNPNDAGGLCVFTSDFLTVSVNSASGFNSGVRANVGVNSGKYYFEIQWLGTPAGADTACGIARFDTDIQNLCTNWGADVIVTFGAGGPGRIVNSGSSTGIDLGTINANDVVGTAADLDNARVWQRINAGNWNGGSSNDPTTNIGGQVLSGAGPNFMPAGVLSVTGVSLKLVSAAFLFAAPTNFLPLPTGLAVMPSKRRVTPYYYTG
jgi:hypothetical protein